MCFSASVSFLAAGATAAVAAAIAYRARGTREAALAVFPLTFAVQQTLEGLVWLRLGETGAIETGLLASGFLIVALLVWPVLAPTAALLVERSTPRRRIITASLAAGLAVAAYLAVMMLSHPYEARVRGGCIAYLNDVNYSRAVEALYGFAVCVPLLVSSHRKILVFGVLVVAGAAVSSAILDFARVSAWCFFAAVASLALVGWPRAPQGESGAASKVAT